MLSKLTDFDYAGSNKAQKAPIKIDVADIEAIIAKLARIPPKSVSTDDKSILEHLDRDLKHLVFGQNEAIENLADAIKLSRAGLKAPDSFIGPLCLQGLLGWVKPKFRANWLICWALSWSVSI